MKDNITSREDIFLAKIAGKDVDIKTMTPPVAASMREKLMLDIAERIDNIEAGSGGGGDTYETVAEIEVGTMEVGENGYTYAAEGVTVPTLDTSEVYYFNDADNPSTVVAVVDDGFMIGFNVTDPEHPTPSDPSKQIYALLFGDDDSCIVFSDTKAIENTTVKILKKVSGGETITVDSELSETSDHPVQNKVITAALNAHPVDFIITADLDPETEEITKASASLADVLAVADECRNIVFILHTAAEIGGTTVNVYDRFADSNIENHGGGNGVVSFSKIEKDSGTPIMFSIIAASGDQNGKWVYDEVTLATATP